MLKDLVSKIKSTQAATQEYAQLVKQLIQKIHASKKVQAANKEVLNKETGRDIQTILMRELLSCIQSSGVNEDEAYKKLNDILVCGLELNDGTLGLPLHVAAQQGNTQLRVVRTLIMCGADPSLVDKHGKDAITYAQEKQNKELIAWLNKRTQEDISEPLQTELFEAVKGGDTSRLEELINKDVDLNVKDEAGMTPLHYAARINEENLFGTGHFITKLLVDAGCKLNVCDNTGKTALHYAIESGEKKTIQFLFEKGATVNINCNLEKDGATLLHIAIKKNNLMAVKYLIEKNNLAAKLLSENKEKDSKAFYINFQDSEGKTALHYAVECENAKLVNLLVTAEACDVNLQDNNGKTPLYHCVDVLNRKLEEFSLNNTKDYYKIVDILLTISDKNQQNSEGQTILVYAISQTFSCADLTSFIELLLKKNFNNSLPDNKGKTPLNYSIIRGDDQITNLLIAENAPANSINPHDGKSLLHEIVENPTAENESFFNYSKNRDNAVLIQRLIEKGAVATHRDKKGKTALHYAVEKGVIELVKALSEAVNVQDSQGKTALHYAVEQSHSEIVKFLITIPGCDLNLVDNSSRTAESYAVHSIKKLFPEPLVPFLSGNSNAVYGKGNPEGSGAAGMGSSAIFEP